MEKNKKELKGVHKYAEFQEENIVNRVKKMVQMRDALDPSTLEVKFSYGNRKTGKLVPSVSLIPVADCSTCSLCRKGCYDVRHVCWYPTVQRQRANNSAIYKADPERFMRELEDEIKYRSFFRFFTGGDLKDAFMWESIVGIAMRNPACQILMFTKQHEIVNSWLDVHPEGLPANLHVLLSGWRGDTNINRHNLPVSSPVWEDGAKSCMCTDEATFCEGDCTACAKRNGGCWSAGKGQTILFEAH